jgi:hypothetical protein
MCNCASKFFAYGRQSGLAAYVVDHREPNASNAYTSIPSRSAAKAPAEVLCHDSESFYPLPGGETGRRQAILGRSSLHFPLQSFSLLVQMVQQQRPERQPTLARS